ncbi:hypothetical protein H7U19_00925 [Hyunsoonleella sp. SJ7]|uniref:Uncharacterized protein n=1 Tax=Hyunsoonleella aquatilis TaxID=2762758 RepID=A0A923H6H1_9FLAO|nr:hypothetical protein [Hyunsoonleella aquatilis]MBC3756946.1 hypothetical protein [Hyunsoonleella aquatilis]
MKNILRLLLLVIFLMIGVSIKAQEIKVNEVVYEVKKDLIFKDGADVTNTLTPEEKTKIRSAFEKRKLQMGETERVEKQLEKAEKEQKKAEKKQKQAEKALKKKQKAQSNFEKATKKHEVATKKYEKLKKKGKLSPQDEQKWLEKIEKLNTNLAKTKRRL